jgi:hypothetical protein
MIQAFTIFAKQILDVGGFKVSSLPGWVLTALLTAFSQMLHQEVVIVLPLLKLSKRTGKGVLVVDDTTNPKYGLKEWARKMKIVGTSGFEHGYKILLFLWECDFGRIPIGFALWHKGSKSINELALTGFSLLRNRHKLKPEAVLFDGAFSTDKILKRLEDYGWPCVARFRNNRKLGNTGVQKLIARGYGEVLGKLKNGVKVKVFRRKSRFFVCNRMTWGMQKAVSLYKRRWKIEEVFRAMKGLLGLNRCQQHSMGAQALYLFVCFVLFACLEINTTHSVYKTAQTVISGQLDLQNLISQIDFSYR